VTSLVNLILAYRLQSDWNLFFIPMAQYSAEQGADFDKSTSWRRDWGKVVYDMDGLKGMPHQSGIIPSSVPDSA
jgi:hypothetical protein